MLEKPDENIALDLSDREAEKPRSDAEMRAKTARYNGFPDGPHRASCGIGFQSTLNAASQGDGNEPIPQDPSWIPGSMRPYKRWSKGARQALRMARPAEVSFDDDPVSTDISTRDFILLYNAVYVANVLGLHLNVAGTFAWYLHCPDQVAAASALAQFLKNYAQWMRDHSYPHATYVYVNENPGNNKFHTHFALHVPKHLAEPFKQWISIHFRKVLGFREYAPRFLKMTVRRRPDSKSQWVWLNYMCKGYDPEGALFCSGDGPVRLGDVIMFHREEAGLLEGKGRRYGISRFLYAKQYQKLVEEKGWPAPGIISPLEEQMKSQVLDATQLYAPFPEQALSPIPGLSYRLRIKEDATRVLEALNLTQLERALGLPLF